MDKIKSKISDMFRQHRVRTVIEALTALKDVQHTKANLHKNEVIVQFDAARITAANPAEKTEASFRIRKNAQPFAFTLGILIILFSIAGCSDMPYTGSALTGNEIDRYRVSTDGNVVCFQDGLDSTCIKLGSQTGDGGYATDGPAIHIYPEKRLYLFYHEGNPIVFARRVGDTSQNGGTGNQGNDNGSNNGNNGGGNNNGNTNGGNNGGGTNNGNTNGGNDGNDGGGNNNGNTNGGNDGNNGGGNNNGNTNGGNDGNDGGGNNNGNTNGGNDGNNGGGNNNGNDDNPGGTNGNDDNNDNPPNSSDDGHGWIIWVYYPDGAIPQDPPTLSESGVTITINGKELADEDITGFAQFIGPNDEAGIQFFYPTQSAELLDLRVQMEGIVNPESTVKFNINYLWNSQ